MRFQRVSKAVVVGAAMALALSACAPGGSDSSSEASKSTESNGGAEVTNSGLADLGDVTTKDDTIKVTVGAPEFISYNGFTPQTYSTYNSAITDRMFAGFYYMGTDGTIYPNKELGSYEKVSDDPLTIKYTINENAKWSDGTPITVADSVFAWATQNLNLNSGDKDKPLFNSVSTDLGDTVPKGPEGAADGKEFTVTFKDPDPDWQLQTWMLHPAHVVAKKGGLSTDELVQAIRDGDSKKLEKAAKFWNEGWMTKPGTLPDEADVPVSGPYKLESWKAGESVTLTANENYYGTAPATKNLNFRFLADTGMVQALQNKDVDVIAPQPTVDTLAQLEGLGKAVSIQQGDTLTWEHLDFNFAEGNEMNNLELRKAFAMCVPRQEIVDNLVKPLNPEATVMNAREVFPFQDNYQEVVDASYDGRYDQVDIDGAKKILEEQDAVGTEIRIGYSAPNERRTNEVAAIKSSCDKAGFKVKDAGDAKFFAPGGTQERGDYEVALFAWAGSGQITSGQNIYSTGKPQNYGKYSNEAVDEAWTKLATSLDPAVHAEQTKVIEKLLWDDLYGIPLFAHPGLSASGSDIQNVRHTATQSGIVWNAEQWLRAE
ncbi:ABC transporter family substrate-binding protein [Arthrobacter sp. NIO-1057]|uniref:ABC transporter family substrate-binding protein n=1 Tax=Arthrobacter sp. NIO-1057 TaxID=993071 RepID=UPI00071CA7CD|nr:ABC transporter family substrate-binding protein [Arthrobacter sp. NIO-1057]KSU66453.1 ABC transporter substrate-binding protein [Arthrobacter sp. NIO-1057]SCC14743.1 peptide/nickel transport system substrate-binding protein [Arthrobacter sp. NIO-1057]